MHLTILICTHNRSALLDRVLISLNQAHRPASWTVDIMVVANACTDATATFLQNYQAQASARDWLPLVWHAEATPGKSHALNSAIPKLRSDLVAFVDDDHRVDKSYLVSICQAAESYPDTAMFCGRILPDWDGSEPAWVHDTGPYRIYPLPVPRQDYGETSRPIGLEDRIPGGGNLFLKRKIFDRIGNFAVELGPQGHNLGGGEDTDFVLRALNTGEQLIYIPEVLQYHYVDPARLRLGYLLRKSFQRSRAGVKTRHTRARIPLYMWRKLATYSFHAVYSLQWNKTRFFLVRMAAVLGEMRGIHT